MSEETRDLRGPEWIGEYLLYQKEKFFPGVSLSNVYETRKRTIDMFELVPEADGKYVGPLDRYGDPRAK